MNPLVKELEGKFLATGVGSLPHDKAAAAVQDIFDILATQIPFWPQLPKRSFYENMYVQFGGQLPGLEINEKDKSIRVVAEGDTYLAQLEKSFQNIQEADVDAFAIDRRDAEGLYLFIDQLKKKNWSGWVKAQVIGPLSLGLTLLDQAKNPILYNPELREILAPLLGLKAAWLIGQLRANAQTRVVIFIDEPYLVAVGTSACSLPRQEIIDMINRVVKAIHEAGAVAGLHCCGNTDWDMVLATDIDILNFDGWGYLDKLMLYEDAVGRFLKKGGIPAIGIVPNTDILKERGLEEKIVHMLGPHKNLWARGALITTSCGCAGLTEELARTAHELSVRVAGRLKAGLV